MGLLNSLKSVEDLRVLKLISKRKKLRRKSQQTKAPTYKTILNNADCHPAPKQHNFIKKTQEDNAF